MKINMLFLIGFVAFGTLAFADDDALLKALMSGDRAARKNAAGQLEDLSREDLISLAQNAIRGDALKPSEAIYAFHQVLAIAQKKGFGFDDALVLLKKSESLEFKFAILDWLKEFGVKKVSLENAAELLSDIGEYFSSKQEQLQLRVAAHKVCRELAWKLNVSLKKDKKMTKAQQEKIKRVLRGHIDKVCRIVGDESEDDESIEAFAGYIPYYRSYARDGIYSEEDLKATLKRAAKQGVRAPSGRISGSGIDNGLYGSEQSKTNQMTDVKQGRVKSSE